MSKSDPFGATSRFEKADGSDGKFIDLNSLSGHIEGKLENIPFSIRILLESALRKCDGFLIDEDDVKRIASWSQYGT